MPACRVTLPSDRPTGYDDKNRITGKAYDAAGNLLTLGNYEGTYDSEDRLVKLRWVGAGTNPDVNYAYGPNGERVMTTNSSASSGPVLVSSFVYEAGGALAAEYRAPAFTGTRFVTVDHLGSNRVMFDSAGGVMLDSEHSSQE